MVQFLLSREAVVVPLLSIFGCTAGQDGRSEGFRDRERHYDPGDAGEDELDPVKPAPACCVGEKAADQWANGGTCKGRCAKCCHGNAALFRAPEVGECASDKGHWGGEGDAVDKAADEESADVFGNSTGDYENNCEGESNHVDRLAAVHLAEWSEDEGTY